PGVEVALESVIERQQAGAANREGDGERPGEESPRAGTPQCDPEERVDRAELDEQTDVPPRRCEVVELVRREPHAEPVETEGAGGRLEPATEQQARNEKEQVRGPPQGVDAQRAAAPELAHRQRDADAANEESPRQAEAPGNQEEADALVARPADPAK